MVSKMPVMLEVGLRGKKCAAVGVDWPGLERGGKTEQAALESLQAYLPRYAKVVARAGLAVEFEADKRLEVVERYEGSGSTDFWGISFVPSRHDGEPVSADELGRQLELLRACWDEFDEIAARVSAELRKGPRGGGRDRDRVVRHTFAAELDWSPKIGVETPIDEMLTVQGLAVHRENFVNALRQHHAEDKMARKWPLPYMIRHTAYHVMDHAWEMEDKDLSGSLAAGSR